MMKSFSNVLLGWYEENKRILPWRDSTDPYQIWISEVILQQTQVKQGYDYYMRFMKRFPNVETLALASEDEVMKYWQGLGYYSRARNLHAAAQSIKGDFPSTYKEILALKGVGEYTAAAIASFAYQLPYAVLDGNVFRVLSRYFGIDTPIDTTAGKKEFKSLAQELLDEAHPDLYNQAIMDFGAIQCTPKSTKCEGCPFSDSCYALQNRVVESLPVKSKSIKIQNRYFNYLFIKQGPSTFIQKRSNNDIWRNLYEFPMVETLSSVELPELVATDAFKLLFGNARIEVKPVVKDWKHILSHRHIYASFYEIVLNDDIELPHLESYQRIQIEDLEEYAVPRLIHRFCEQYIF